MEPASIALSLAKTGINLGSSKHGLLDKTGGLIERAASTIKKVDWKAIHVLRTLDLIESVP